MIVLGINASYHDTAAALVRDGQVVAAIEEERLFRVKHTDRFPVAAVDACLEIAGVTLDEVDLVAVNHAEESYQSFIEHRCWSQQLPPAFDPREVALAQLATAVDPQRVRFVPHHVAHAASAYLCSGFEEALVVSLDGIGDDDVVRQGASGLIARGRGSDLERLHTLTAPESLGFLYGQITKLLGFREFDEQKVMGLAAYGDPARYRRLFSNCYELTGRGRYRIDRRQLIEGLCRQVPPRSSDEPLGREHEDVAAACQETLETIVLHVLGHYARDTGLDRLAMAGGVALNCSMNGGILTSGLFREIFVQPASHDAGGALGAALWVAAREAKGSSASPRRLRSVAWGTPLPPTDRIEATLRDWGGLVSWQKLGDAVVDHTAQQLAAGRVVGWMQGRSELGPRALGNRSILADPRRAETREVVNRAVKKREGFRPFGPSVLAEELHEYFEAPDGVCDLSFMLFAVPVRADARASLEAVTHVDGTARVATVRRETSPRYWELIARFGSLTGVPVLLNTSFNNSAEPIVDSVEDALVALLTTGLDHLVVDDFWITRREPSDERWLDCSLSIAECADVVTAISPGPIVTRICYRHQVGLAAGPPVEVGEATTEVLRRADGRATVRELLNRPAASEPEIDRVREEIRLLWWHRFLRLLPSPTGSSRARSSSG